MSSLQRLWLRNLVVLALALGMLVWIRRVEVVGRDEETRRVELDRKIFHMRREQLRAFTLHHGGETITCRRDGTDGRLWVMESPVRDLADAAACNGLANDLEGREFSKVVEREASPASLEAYGLSTAPRAVLHLELEAAPQPPPAGDPPFERGRRELVLGMRNPIGFSSYVRRTDDDRIGLTVATLDRLLCAEPSTYRDLRIFTFAPPEVLAFALRYQSGAEVEARRDGKTWRLVKPREARADGAACAERAAAFATLRLKGFLADLAEGEAPDETTKLDRPWLHAVLTTADGRSHELRVGEKLPDAKPPFRFPVMGGRRSRTVGTIGMAERSRLHVPWTELRDMRILPGLSWQDVVAIRFTRGGTAPADGADPTKASDDGTGAEDALERDGSGAWTIVSPRREKADEDAVQAWLKELVAMKAFSVIREDDADLPPERRLDPDRAPARLVLRRRPVGGEAAEEIRLFLFPRGEEVHVRTSLEKTLWALNPAVARRARPRWQDFRRRRLFPAPAEDWHSVTWTFAAPARDDGKTPPPDGPSTMRLHRAEGTWHVSSEGGSRPVSEADSLFLRRCLSRLSVAAFPDALPRAPAFVPWCTVDGVDGEGRRTAVTFPRPAFADGAAHTVLARRDDDGTFVELPLLPDLQPLLYNEITGLRPPDAAPRTVAAPALPRLLVETDRGAVEVELFEDDAPNTVANFVSLARSGFYDGTAFHRVVSDFVVQGGDPNSKNDDPDDDGKGGPGHTIDCEINPRPHLRGSLAMAHHGTDTGGSQFYFCLRPQPHLDKRHTVFGRVIQGMAVLDRMKRGDRIRQVRIRQLRDHRYEPVVHRVQ